METAVKEVRLKDLRGKKCIVKPVHRLGGWVPEGNDSNFMNDGAKNGYVVPVTKGNLLVDPLSGVNIKERTELAKELALESVDDFNVYRKKNYWRNNQVDVDRNGLHLDLSITADLIKYLILRSDPVNISPTWAERKNTGTYKFALVLDDEELVEDVKSVENYKMAYKLLGAIDGSINKMKDFLHVYYLRNKVAKKPPTTATADWLKREIGKIVEDDTNLFIEILDDVNYELKILVQKSVSAGAIQRIKHEYTFPGADKSVGVLKDLLDYLNDDRNQEAKMKLIYQVENVGGKGNDKKD